MVTLTPTVYVVLGDDLREDETFVAKVFDTHDAASEWADTQNARQHEIVYSVHDRWIEDGDAEFVSE